METKPEEVAPLTQQQQSQKQERSDVPPTAEPTSPTTRQPRDEGETFGDEAYGEYSGW